MKTNENEKFVKITVYKNIRQLNSHILAVYHLYLKISFSAVRSKRLT